MTVIAYRDRTLAGDSCVSDGGAIADLHNKLRRFPTGVLYGRAGDYDDRALVKLLEGVKTPDELPSRDVLKTVRCDISALLVFPNGEVWGVEVGKKSGEAVPLTEPIAIGSGRDLAMGAMLGNPNLSAAEACAVAASRNIYCREPIHTLSLDDSPQASS